MRLASKNLAAFSACVLWLAGATPAWTAEPAAGPAVAKVISLSGEAKAGGRELQSGVEVAAGEEITSGRVSYLTLEFDDHSTVRVGPDSRLRIEVQRAAAGEFETQLRLDTGALEAIVARRRAPNFRITTPLGNIATREADVRVRGAGEALLVEVLGGSVMVAGISARKRITVDAGYGTRVTAMDASLAPVQLLAAPNVAGIEAQQHRPMLRLRFAPLAGAQRYRVIAATDRDLRAVVVENTQRRPDVRMIDLRDGEYFYGVRGIDALGLEGAEARGRVRLKARPVPPAVQAPEPGAVLQPGGVTFSWAAAEEALAYRFQLATDEDFSALLVNRGGLAARQLAVEKLEAGRYYWRVASVRPDGDEGPFGDPVTLTLQAPAPQPPQ